MALISCPECGKQISDSTPSCPHCGYQFSTIGTSAVCSPTKIGDISMNYPVGIAMIVIGVILLPVSFFGFFLFLIPGIIALVVAIPLIALGISKISGTRSICCPHCGKPAEVGKNFESHKCYTCKKVSVREGDFLKPVL